MDNHGVRVHASRRAIAWGAVLLFMCCGGYEAAADSMTLTTYYPSPSGVYKRLRAGTYKFIPYRTRAEMDVAPMPDLGTFAYCQETGGYYASQANGTSTQWSRIMLDDTPENILAQGSMDFPQPNNSYAWIRPLNVTTGKLYYYNDFIRSTVKVTRAGLYTAAASGRLCEVLCSSPASGNSPTAFMGPAKTTSFRLRLRINGTYVSDLTSFSLYVAPDQDNDCRVDATEMGPYNKCYCANFNINGQLALTVGNQPYVGLLSYGVKSDSVPIIKYSWDQSGTWSPIYAGYIVHVDDIRLYK